jgi:hypothetical protein
MTSGNRGPSTSGDSPEASRERDESTETMADVSHSHPHTDRGAINRPFERGPTVAADGGQRGAAESRSDETAPDDDEEPSDDDGTMADVDHTPPGDAPSADGVFERGNENEEP